MGVTSGIRRDMRRAMQDGVVDVAKDIMDAARADAPPSPPPGEDPAPQVALRERGYVEALPGGGVEIGFRTPYAAKQHEDFRLKHPRGGVPKYLERHVLAAAVALENRIAVQVRKVMAERTVTGPPR